MSGYLKSIHDYCKWCMNSQSREIRKCSCEECTFYPVRNGRGITGISNLQRIKAHCIECSGGIRAVGSCWALDCPTFSYRLGKNPKLKGRGRSAEEMKKLRELRA